MTTFSPTLKTLTADDRGRINIGTVDSSAKGRSFGASVDPQGRILLTPTAPDPVDEEIATTARGRAVERD